MLLLEITKYLGMPRLSHFPSRLGDNRSASGIESRRHDLDLYFKSLSRWHLYPAFLELFVKVKIPESLLLDHENVATIPQMMRHHHRALFYKGDVFFGDMASSQVDAVADAIYN